MVRGAQSKQKSTELSLCKQSTHENRPPWKKTNKNHFKLYKGYDNYNTQIVKIDKLKARLFPILRPQISKNSDKLTFPICPEKLGHYEKLFRNISVFYSGLFFTIYPSSQARPQ